MQEPNDSIHTANITSTINQDIVIYLEIISNNLKVGLSRIPIYITNFKLALVVHPTQTKVGIAEHKICSYFVIK